MKAEEEDCDWCGPGTKACVQVTYATLEGTVLDYAYLCADCAKRGATWNGTMIDAKD